MHISFSHRIIQLLNKSTCWDSVYLTIKALCLDEQSTNFLFHIEQKPVATHPATLVLYLEVRRTTYSYPTSHSLNTLLCSYSYSSLNTEFFTQSREYSTPKSWYIDSKILNKGPREALRANYSLSSQKLKVRPHVTIQPDVSASAHCIQVLQQPLDEGR